MARYCNQCNRKFGFFEQDYDGICKDCYDKKIEEEKIEKQKEREKLKRKELEQQEKYRQKERERIKKEEEKKRIAISEIEKKLKDELTQQIYITYLYNSIFKMDFHSLEIEFKSNYTTTKDIIENIINKCIKKIGSSTLNIQNVMKVFCNNLFFIEVFEDCVNYEVKYGGLINGEWQPMSIEKWLKESLNIDYINKCINILFKEEVFDTEMGYSILAFINKVEIMDFDGNMFSKLKVDKTYRYYSDEEQYEYTGSIIINLMLCYYYACFILYSSLFMQNIKVLKNNIELYTMIDNLKRNNADSIYIRDKVYPIYKMDYSNTFKSIITEVQFLNILLVDDINIEYNLPITNLMKEFETLKNKNYIDLQSALANIDIDIEKINDVLQKNEKNLYNEILICFIWLNVIKDNNNYNTLLESINNSKKTYLALEEKSKYIQARKDKERFLNGDFSKEIEMQKQKVEYSNVKDGYEFEEYVANLYRKLGYTIEEVTKKSGDQGADVIAYKDNVKYVIQVKFYNNPVGNKAVQEVVGAIGMYQANKGIVVTNSTFTSSAIELAQANNIELVDGEKIEEYKKIIIDSI